MDEWEAVNGGAVSDYEKEDVEESVFESLVSDDSEILPFQAFCELNGISTPDSDTYREFEESYAGTWGSFREFSDDYASNFLSSDLDDFVVRYFDYESFSRDLAFDYSVERAPDWNVYVFRDL